MAFFRKNGYNLLSIIIAAASLVATIVINRIQEKHFFAVLVVVVAVEVMLIILSYQHLRCVSSYEKENEVLKKEKEDLQLKLEDKEKERQVAIENAQAQKEKMASEYDSKIAIMLSNLKNVSKMNNEFCNKIPTTTLKAYHLLDALSKASVDADVMQKEIIASRKEFAIGLYEIYKRYTTSFLPNVVGMVESYLTMHGHNHPVSATIKLFDQPLISVSEDRSKITVYSAFRDKRTFESERKREIGEEPYTIDGNIDFSMCLQKDHFIINNAKKESGNYLNQHVDFDAYYNCAVVVAIKVKQESSYKYLGYLCCDCLNSSLKESTYEEDAEIFTQEVAHLLFAMAQIYGTFLETLESNWLDKMKDIEGIPQSFLSLVYEQTFHGKDRIWKK